MADKIDNRNRPESGVQRPETERRQNVQNGQRESSARKTGGSNVFHGTAANAYNTVNPFVEKSLRQKQQRETQTLSSQAMKSFEKDNPLYETRNIFSQSGNIPVEIKSSKNEQKIKDARTAWDNYIETTKELSPEEYSESFSELFGMSPEEYRTKVRENPEFQPKFPSPEKIKSVTAAIENRQKYSGEQIQQRQDEVVTQRVQENKEAAQDFQNERDSQGIIRRGCSRVAGLFGTSAYDTLEAIGKDKKDVEELQQLAKSGNDFAFNQKYQQMTGVGFRVENIEKAEKASVEYLQNSDTKKLVETSKKLGKANSNYSLDSFEAKIYDPTKGKPLPPSPLENALFEYFGGEANRAEAIRATKSCIRNAIKSLDVENADAKTQYETLEKAWMDVVEKKKNEYPDFKNAKKYKEQYEQAIKEAYGDNIARDTLEKYVSNVEFTYGLAKTAAVIGSAVVTGGAGTAAAAVAAASAGALTNTVEESTDKDGLTAQDYGKILTEAYVDFGAFAIGGAAANGLNKAMANSVTKAAIKGQVSQAEKIIDSRMLSSVVDGSVMASSAEAFSNTANTVLNTPLDELTFGEVVESAAEGALTGAINGAAFGLIFGNLPQMAKSGKPQNRIEELYGKDIAKKVQSGEMLTEDDFAELYETVSKRSLFSKYPKTKQSKIAAKQEPTKLHLADEKAMEEFYNNLEDCEKDLLKSAGVRLDDPFLTHGLLQKSLSQYDKPETITARCIDAIKRLMDSSTLKAETLPQEDLTAIRNEFYDSRIKGVPSDHKMIVLTGKAGSGKSTVMRELLEERGGKWYIPDADEIKPKLPGYDEAGAGYVHDASVAINTQFLKKAIEDGHNLVFQTTGWWDYIKEIVGPAKANGYEIDFVHVDVTNETAIARSLDRWKKTGRFVDPARIESALYTDQVKMNFFKDKEFTEGMSFTLYDNNGNKVNHDKLWTLLKQGLKYKYEGPINE